jgi:hypothetical protein
MGNRRVPRPFLVVVVDEDSREFAVAGPMIDDRPWTQAVWKTRQTGRMVRCFVTLSEKTEVLSWGKEKGLTLRERIILPTLD